MNRKSKRICGISDRHIRRLAAEKLKKNMNNELQNIKKVNCENNSDNEKIICSNNQTSYSVNFTSNEFTNTRSVTSAEELMKDEDLDTDGQNETLYDNDLNKNLRKWSNNYNISHTAMNDLLKILNESGTFNIPLNAKTLMQTPRHSIVVKNVIPGEYIHLGIEFCIRKKLSYNNFDMPDNILLNVGIDGLPLSKSSGLCLWPILIILIEPNINEPLLVGAYAGYKKPNDVNEFLHDFVVEYKNLLENGIIIENKKISIRIKAFCCDAPARSFLTGMRGHTSFHGCLKCCQIGTSKNKRVTYADHIVQKFTDKDYSQRLNKNRFIENNTQQINILESVGIGMVTQFPTEPMHLFDLGVTKKLLTCILKGKVKEKRLSQNEKNIASDNLVSLRIFIPAEFCRKPRSFDEVQRWKSIEFRQFALYSGILILRDLLDEDAYYHFLLFSCAYRLLSCHESAVENSDCANAMLEEFVSNFSLIYGEEQLTYNVHNLLHISDCVQLYGPLDRFSAYTFENYLQILKRKIRKPSKILQQIYKRTIELNFEKLEDAKTGFRKLLKTNSYEKIYEEYWFETFVLKCRSPDDCCCIETENGNIPVKVVFFKIENEHEFIECKRFLLLEPFFNQPINSIDIGIVKAKQISNNIEKFEIKKILYKFVRFPLENSVLLIPLLHLWQPSY